VEAGVTCFFQQECKHIGLSARSHGHLTARHENRKKKASLVDRRVWVENLTNAHPYHFSISRGIKYKKRYSLTFLRQNKKGKERGEKEGIEVETSRIGENLVKHGHRPFTPWAKTEKRPRRLKHREQVDHVRGGGKGSQVWFSSKDEGYKK